ncbi:hypothetical protein ACFWZT_08745 [Streptomyces alboflavus]|uniref:hypothetical protein n=1 Tax=Streptomyces alboflavus TaxID=67267 RepID=UPI0036AE1AD2
MDQGLAGLIAGIAGLVGAVVGGGATAYGARIGAQKTIEAAQTQVHHQSAAEHQHWVREHRKQACLELVDGFGGYVPIAVECLGAVNQGNPVDREKQAELRRWCTQLVVSGGHLQLWGTTELISCGGDMTHEITLFTNLMSRWAGVRVTGDSETTRQHQAECQEQWTKVTQARRAFTSASREALAKHA